MKARTDPAARRLPDAQRARLKALLGALPDSPGPDEPALRHLLDFGLTLRVPWWAPTSNALSYMVRLGAVDTALDSLRRLEACVDWGTQTQAEEVT